MSTTRLDLFTRKRLEKFIPEFRTRTGVLPTLRDLADAGFDRAAVDAAEHDCVITKSYLTLTSGSVVKGYVLHVE